MSGLGASRGRLALRLLGEGTRAALLGQGEEQVGQCIRASGLAGDVEARLLGINALEFLGLDGGG